MSLMIFYMIVLLIKMEILIIKYTICELYDIDLFLDKSYSSQNIQNCKDKQQKIQSVEYKLNSKNIRM